MEPHVEFRTLGSTGDVSNATVEVAVLGAAVAQVPDASIPSLCSELSAWAAVANDAKPRSFVFSGGGRSELLGSFRIEPRPVGWQFTSTLERRRHDPLPLSAFLEASAAFCRRFDAA